jgi:hypothetical protein
MTIRPLFTAGFAAFALLAVSSEARAEGIIRNPGDNPKYVIEIEPHLSVGYVDPFPGGAAAFGFGARFSIPLMDPGFVKSINDTIAISFGADVLFYNSDTVALPVALQWNFYLAPQWSVFGEPGLEIDAGDGARVHPALWVGGRYHFTDHVALTLRLGFPTLSIGLSFM